MNGGPHPHLCHKGSSGNPFSDLQETDHLKDPEGLSHGGLADPELLYQLLFRGQSVSGLDLAGKDGIPDLGDDVIGNFS